ncbi:universal stress protein [Microlunatus ginsengisoli]|uniref:Universal stress protein n=1 Tax=Microlunatus ginsengisoli TaxID=363863 RepID=A0ABP6ZX53_9ACTN
MKILVGYIPTPEGLAAVDYAIAEAKHNGASLTVLNTAKNGDYSDPQFATAEDVDTLDTQLKSAGIDHEIRRPTDGKPAAEAMLETATDVQADLIVIGIRRRNPLGKLITGSTAQAILLGADCPVVGVKPAMRSQGRPAHDTSGDVPTAWRAAQPGVEIS